MSKSFSQAPKPPQLTADVISAFERRGAGQDTRARISPIVEGREPTNVGDATEAVRLDQKNTNVGTGSPTNVAMVQATNTDWGLPQKRALPSGPTISRIDLPESWHRRFKIACTRTDKKMVDEVTDFIKRHRPSSEKE